MTRADFGNELRSAFPEGEEGEKDYIEYRKQGDDAFFRYFVDNMFIGPAGTGKLQASVLITGQLGAGKTCLLCRLGWGISKEFGLPISTDFTAPYPEVFGEYEYLSDLDIIDELALISEISEMKAKNKLTVDATDKIMKEKKSKLYKHIVLWDEIYKKVSNRRPNDTINMLIGDINKQQRHFKSLFISAAPAENELDRKSWNQYVNVEISGYKLAPTDEEPHKDDWSYWHVYNRTLIMETSFLLYRPPWHRLFDSESPPTIRQKLDAKDLSRIIKEVYCPKCGIKYDGGHLFCGKCGVRLERSSSCDNPDCGCMILPKYKFCPKCGWVNKNHKIIEKGKDKEKEVSDALAV